MMLFVVDQHENLSFLDSVDKKGHLYQVQVHYPVNGTVLKTNLESFI